jgi:predicted CoA-substrate-specific enzyme activase
MNSSAEQVETTPCIGLDIGVFAVKGVLIDGEQLEKVCRPASGNPTLVSIECLKELLAKVKSPTVKIGLTGNNARLVAGKFGVVPILEVEALQAGLAAESVDAEMVLSLGHENMYYLELDHNGAVTFFNRNGQCAAGSGSFWYQQATRMGYNDRELAEVAVEAGSAVKISGRCAVFAKSDMTHAINEGASQMSVAAGMAKALVDLVVTGVAQNRIGGSGTLAITGGVANNRAIYKYLAEYCREREVKVLIPPDHEYIEALGAARHGVELPVCELNSACPASGEYSPENPLPPLTPEKVIYSVDSETEESFDLSTVYLGVDCGSVSTKCALLDGTGRFIGGVYLPTAGRPVLQVLELIKQVEEKYGNLLQEKPPVVACTTGSGRFLARKILGAEYAVDEITCQAEGVKSLSGDGTLSIIEIGGEDSKFIQIKNGVLFDYNMNPVCAAGTGTFLENLAELLGVKIKEEFSQRAFQAEYAIDLGDTCTLLSQSTLVSASSRGLPLEAQLASLAYSSARNYLSKTVENRTLEGKLVFTGATAKNHALAAAFASECGREVYIPPNPELTGALGAALTARIFHLENGKPAAAAGSLDRLNAYTLDKKACKAKCRHEHNCQLDIVSFSDGSKFIYGDRCGRFSEMSTKDCAEALPGYEQIREDLFMKAAGEPLSEGTEVGIACGGLFFELYPFWAAFFRSLGAKVVLSGKSDEKILEQGKMDLAAEMCYPVEVLVGHYRELVTVDPEYIFIPEVIDLEPLPWAAQWPRSSSCPLLMMIKGVTVHALGIPEEKVLHAQINFREGPAKVADQMLPMAKKLLGRDFSQTKFQKAMEEGYRALSKFHSDMEEEGRSIIEGLTDYPDAVVALILGRSYTLYDPFISKDLMKHASQRGLIALSQDFLIEYLRGWYEGRIKSALLDPLRDEFNGYMKEKIEHMDNIYPAQLQHILSAALAAQFFNERLGDKGLPKMHLVLQDPFRCGPNSMLRHYLGNVSEFLRLTLDEHTAPAGMITRLEAFRNTCRSRKSSVNKPFITAKTISAADQYFTKVLIPNMTSHMGVFRALFENRGIEAVLLPRSKDRSLALARRYTNGEECLPFIQNIQDYLEYAEANNYEAEKNGAVMLQGWACGPCRYGLYASAQSMVVNRAGYGPQKVCAFKVEDIVKRFGQEFIIAAYDGMLAVDTLYKMLHKARPYELNRGEAEALFEHYCEKVYALFRTHRFKLPSLVTGGHLKPVEELIAEAADRFAAIPRNEEQPRPLIMIAGEYYVRLDDRCNNDLIKQIEAAGGEVSLAPATEFFIYTAFANYRRAEKEFAFKRSISNYINKLGYAAVNWISHRDEHRVQHSASSFLNGIAEPDAAKILEHSIKYIPEHTAGEPPMTVGRTGALADHDHIAGAIFVGPFTCMPAAVVEAQQGVISEDTGIPIISVYYDGRDNSNRDEFIHSLVFQARQNMEVKL